MTRAEVKGLIGSRWAPVAEGMHRLRGVLETVAAPLLDLFIRIWLAQSFFASGVLKTINWPATVFLYTAEHPVPGVSPAVAAAIGTGFELVCPLLLLIGLFTRAAALPLFAWALFLQLTYAALDAQVYQILLLGLLILRGAGSISRWTARSRRIFPARRYHSPGRSLLSANFSTTGRCRSACSWCD
ncbi:MAG: DoxX family protein [Rhodospirillales bacterium]|nr:DoxX family protein [Rhodospirillales bacterium]